LALMGKKTKKVKTGIKKAGKEVEKSKRKDEKELKDDKEF